MRKFIIFALILIALPVFLTAQTDVNLDKTTLASITAIRKHTVIEINWATTMGVARYKFEVQKFFNDWETVATVAGVDSTVVKIVKNKEKVIILGPITIYNCTLFNNGEAVKYRLKIKDRNGAITYSETLKIDEVIIAKPIELTAAPNPFTSQTMISFLLPTEQKTKIKVYDANGYEIATLVDETLSAGTHGYVFTSGSLKSGFYFVNLEGDAKTAIGPPLKITLIR